MKRGYKTDTVAAAAAKRMGLFGLTDSGQQCCPVQLPDGSWAFWTAHNYFNPSEEPGKIVVPGGKYDPMDDCEMQTFSKGFFTVDELEEFLHDTLGVHPEWTVRSQVGADHFGPVPYDY